MSEKTLLEFIYSFLYVADNKQEKYILGEVTEEEVAILLEVTGFNVSGFRRIIDNLQKKNPQTLTACGFWILHSATYYFSVAGTVSRIRPKRPILYPSTNIRGLKQKMIFFLIIGT